MELAAALWAFILVWGSIRLIVSLVSFVLNGCEPTAPAEWPRGVRYPKGRTKSRR